MQAENLKNKRPTLVWLIVALMIYGCIRTAYLFYIVHSGQLKLNPEMTQYFSNLSMLNHLISYISLAINFTGAIFLFRLKKVSCYLITLALAINLAQGIYQYFTTNWVAAMASVNAVSGIYIGYIYLALIMVYSWYLKSKNVLS